MCVKCFSGFPGVFVPDAEMNGDKGVNILLIFHNYKNIIS